MIFYGVLSYAFFPFPFFSAPEGPVQDVVVYSRARSVLVEVVQPVVNTGDFTYDIAFTSLNRNSTVTNVRSPINITKLSPFTFYRATVRINFIMSKMKRFYDCRKFLVLHKEVIEQLMNVTYFEALYTTKTSFLKFADR